MVDSTKGDKPEVITFKASADLVEAMRGIPNRSDFIRAAILSALESVCPLCSGTGILTPKQAEHWASFAATHSLRECDECHEVHLLCEHEDRPRRSAGGGARRPRARRSAKR